MQVQPIIEVFQKNNHGFHPVVPFAPATDKLIQMDISESNNELTTAITGNTPAFCTYIEKKLADQNARYGIGGYNELRNVYSQNTLFGKDDIPSSAAKKGPKPEEPRRLHIGKDIWGKAGTPVHLFMGGLIHSFKYNSQEGDYGATIIMLHQLDAKSFCTLYGHLSLADLKNISIGQFITRGEKIGHFGEPHENGNWPPHLHFQVIVDIEQKEGDYPGVCKYSEREKYLYNCPDPEWILQLEQFL